VTASLRPGQLRIKLNMANIMFITDPQRAHSQPVRIGGELEIITDSDIEALVRTQDIEMESSI
jgi:hypothetical protein